MPTYKNDIDSLIQELRSLVLEHNGPIEQSPHYDQLARLLVSECIVNNSSKK